MKINTILLATTVLFCFASQSSFAAKENFERSKPHVNMAGKPCDVKDPKCKKAMKEKMMKKKKQQVKSSSKAKDYNSSRSNRGKVKKEQLEKLRKEKRQNASSRATDYNSSRSNKADGVRQELLNNKPAKKSKSQATDYNSSRSNKNSSGLKPVEKTQKKESGDN